MRKFDWSRVEVSSADAERLASISRGSDHFMLGRVLVLWDQYVAEVGRGELWLLVELEAACNARDDLELTLALIEGESLEPICRVVDEMDFAFRECTVPYGALWGRPASPRTLVVGAGTNPHHAAALLVRGPGMSETTKPPDRRVKGDPTTRCFRAGRVHVQNPR